MSKSIEVLFLDIDGVMNTQRPFYGKNNKLNYRGNASIKKRILTKVHNYLYWKLPKVAKSVEDMFPILLASDEGFDCYSFSMLISLLDLRPNLYIVVSSVWKFHGLEYMKKLLAHHGVDPSRVISTTPRISSYRGEEIAAWLGGLERNPKLNNKNRNNLGDGQDNTRHEYEVSKFVILDDDCDMEPYMDKLVQTDSYDGLGHRECEKIIEILVNSN